MQAIWFCDEDEIELKDADGATVRVIRSDAITELAHPEVPQRKAA